MVSKKSAPVKTLNVALLAEIAKATDAGGFLYVSKANGLDLATAGLIDVNTGLINPENADEAAARITESGKAMLNTASNGAGSPAATNVASEAKTSPYAIISGAQLPQSKRGNKGGGAPTVYPFDTMEIGQSFFVPVSEKHPNPVKTLGSTVSVANMRFAVKTDEVKTVTRTKRGPKNRAEVDAAGNKIKETVQVPVYKHTRRFSIRPVKKGVQYGTWTAEADGALIARVPLREND